MAFRSASHHHPARPQSSFLWRVLPKPKNYLKTESGDAIYIPALDGEGDPDTSRLFVMRAKFDEVLRSQSDSSEVSWEYVGEASVGLETVLRPKYRAWTESFRNKDYDEQEKIRAFFLELYGPREINTLEKTARCLAKRIHIGCHKNNVEELLWRSDFREPLLMSFHGKLFLYYVQVQKKAMTFNTLRSWATEITDTGEPQILLPHPILREKEQLWEVQKVKLEDNQESLLISSYKGTHYSEHDEGDSTEVSLWNSSNGSDWFHYSKVYVGGGSELGFVQNPKQKNQLWGVIRLDDGDKSHGWGSLIIHSEDYGLNWTFPSRATPYCYDSSRMIVINDKVLLLGRQNVLWQPDGSVDTSVHAPFGSTYGFNAETHQEELFSNWRSGKIKNKKNGIDSFLTMFSITNLHHKPGPDIIKKIGVFNYLEGMNYWFTNAKRTAIFELNPYNYTLSLLQTLPSAGDTSFASVIPIDNKSFILANYSSDIERTDSFHWSWQQGQYQPSGIYLMNVHVGK